MRHVSSMRFLEIVKVLVWNHSKSHYFVNSTQMPPCWWISAWYPLASALWYFCKARSKHHFCCQMSHIMLHQPIDHWLFCPVILFCASLFGFLAHLHACKPEALIFVQAEINIRHEIASQLATIYIHWPSHWLLPVFCKNTYKCIENEEWIPRVADQQTHPHHVWSNIRMLVSWKLQRIQCG